MAPADRTCLACGNLVVVTGHPSYSEATPGQAWQMYCRKQVWEFDPYEDGLDRFRALLETAQTCPKLCLRDEARR